MRSHCQVSGGRRRLGASLTGGQGICAFQRRALAADLPAAKLTRHGTGAPPWGGKGIPGDSPRASRRGSACGSGEASKGAEATHFVSTGPCRRGYAARPKPQTGRTRGAIFGKTGEDATHQKGGYGLRFVVHLQGLGQLGQLLGDVAGDAGGHPRRVQVERLQPHLPQPLADETVRQVFQKDAVCARVRERHIGLAGLREIRIELNRVADIHYHQKRGPALLDRPVLGVRFGLKARPDHGVVPATRAAHGCAATQSRRGPQETGLLRQVLAALLGLQDEALAAVQVDTAHAGGAVAMAARHCTLKHVLVPRVVCYGGVRPRDLQEIAKFRKKQLLIGPLRSFGLRPAAQEIGVGRHECYAASVATSAGIWSARIEAKPSRKGLRAALDRERRPTAPFGPLARRRNRNKDPGVHKQDPGHHGLHSGGRIREMDFAAGAVSETRTIRSQPSFPRNAPAETAPKRAARRCPRGTPCECLPAHIGYAAEAGLARARSVLIS